MRKPGIAGLLHQQQQKEQFKAVGTQLASAQLATIEEQVTKFKRLLEEFARKHRSEINKSPEFRLHFHKMCSAIGVDPLASSKGFWAEVLGVGDFYYELGVQILDVCMGTRAGNGGLLEVRDLCRILSRRRRAGSQPVSEDDVERAIKKLVVLGNGLRVVSVGTRRILQSVPCELNTDHTALLDAAQATGYCTGSQMSTSLRWTDDRIRLALNFMMREGMAWIDTQAKETQYWFPCLFSGSLE